MSATLLLKNCSTIATFDESIGELKNADILIEGEKIISVGDCRVEKVDRKIDCSSHLVIPGMINTHHHFYQTLTRNLPEAQDAKLFPWLVTHYPIWAGLDEEMIHISTRLACAELLLTGCTTASDHHYLYPSAVKGDIVGTQVAAARSTGIRFAPTRGSMSLSKKNGGLPPDSVVQDEDDILADCERAIDKYHDPSPESMTQLILAPCSPFSVTKKLMVSSARLAREKGVLLHTHLAETLDEEHFCIERTGFRPLALMQELEWIGGDVWYAHGIHFNDDELAILAESGTGVAHCPSSNMRLASGICRVAEMLKMGCRVGLAVDGSASNDSSDILGEARNAMLLQRLRYGADSFSARDALKLATIGGAAILRRELLGRIKPGYLADLAIFNLDSMQYAGAQSDPIAAIVFSGFEHRVDYSIVNGEIVVDKGRLIKANESEIARDANSAAARLYSKRKA